MRPTDPEWLKAARLLGLDCKEPPEALELEQIAKLQYPAPKAWPDRNPLKEALRLDIEAGVLPTVERTRTVTKWREVPVQRDEFMGGDRAVPVNVDDWKSIGGRVRKMEDGTEDESFRVIERRAFAAWPGLPEAKRSEGIRAWLRPLEQAEAHQKEAAALAKPKRGRKPSDAPALLVEILDALDEYAAKIEQTFDRHAMPGPLGESADDVGSFHWLCACVYPCTFKRAPTTFDKHRAGLCALAPYAKPTDFYRLALPDIASKLGVTLNVRHLPTKARKTA